jgi:glycolate oxidase FAD binding subunit
VSRTPGRPPTDADAVVGALPEAVVEPSSVGEAAQIVAESAVAGKSLAFVGGGTDLELGGRPERLDLVVRTRRLDRVLEHAPEDQIVVTEAGVTLAALGRTLATRGQRLALDPPLPERATVGGVIAANAFGPRRVRYGSVRDVIIGISFVRSDGRLARGGGKVVKNVAGFDLPRLLVGSLGTLGLVATATFRLHPLPEETTTLLVPDRTAGEIVALAAQIRGARLEPASVVALWRQAGRFDLAVRFEGFARGVAEQRTKLAALVSSGDRTACETLDAAAADGVWALHDAYVRRGSLRAKVAATPRGFAAVAVDSLAPLLACLEGPGCVWYPTLGLGFVTGEVPAAARVVEAVASARARLGREGGSLVLHAAPDPVRAAVDVWGASPASIGLMKNIKIRFDPDRRLAPGRFVGGI